MSPLVSIIIPARNEAETVGQCLAHLPLDSGDEVIVVDGASHDQTAQIATAGGARVVQSPAGRWRQQNRGAEAARGEVLLFLHADCRLPIDGLQQLRECVAAGGVAGSFRHRIDSPRWPYRLIELGDHLRQRMLRMPYGDQGIFVRRQLFEEVGGFPPVRLMEDVRLVRLLRRRTALRCLPGPLRISPRRWEQRGIARQFLLNQYLLLAERLGVPPDRLARLYYGE